MKEIHASQLTNRDLLLFITTPFCATCHIAKGMLDQIEAAHEQSIFYKMNASLYSEFMQQEQIESVPCLFIRVNNVVKAKVYAFHSVPNIYKHLLKYRADIFLDEQ